MSRSIYIDTNVFIAAFEASEAISGFAWRILDSVNAGVLSAVTSELTLAELLPKPLRDGDKELSLTYEALLRSGGQFDVAPITRSILVRSADMRASNANLKLADAVHLATAREYGCPAFLTSDLRIRAKVDIRVLYLGETSLDEVTRWTA